jgi:hypothetical protein
MNSFPFFGIRVTLCFPRLVSNSSAQVILLLQPPEYLGTSGTSHHTQLYKPLGKILCMYWELNLGLHCYTRAPSLNYTPSHLDALCKKNEFWNQIWVIIWTLSLAFLN